MQREVVFAKSFFGASALKKAAYRYSDKFSVDFAESEHSFICTLTFRSNKSAETIEQLVDEFKKEVVDQDLRESVRLETEGVRNLILAHAFSKTSLVSNE